MFAKRFKDARGMTVSVPPPLPELLLSRDQRRIAIHRARATLHGSPMSTLGRLGLALIASAITYLLAAMYARWLLEHDAPNGQHVIAIVFAVLVFFGSSRLVFVTRSWAIVGPAASAAQLCLVCEYDLREVPRQVDDVTICPECGGAWTIGPARLPEKPELAGQP